MSTQGLKQYLPEAAQAASPLASNLFDNAVSALKAQRHELKEFIKGCLHEGVDYGTIPGTPKPTLYKPGAEKLANLFKLGMHIVSNERDVNIEKNWAMFTYRVELVHLPTGKAVSQCEGSANSQEKKYKSRPAVDMLNTLQKMAQKRAYVGAVIVATGASDFFTQDIEDMDLAPKGRAETSAKDKTLTELANYVYQAKNFKSRRQGDVPIDDIKEQVRYWRGREASSNEKLGGILAQDIEHMEAYLAATEEEDLPH